MSRGDSQLPSIVLWGGGGHALVVAEAILAVGWRINGFFDDDPYAVLAAGVGGGELRRLGTLADGEESIQSGGTQAVLAIGNLPRRRTMLRVWSGSAKAPTVVHPAAVISPSAQLGAGVFVGPRAVVHTLATIYPHAIVNTGAIVEHECQIGENVHLAPGSVIAGRVNIGADTLVGLGAVVLPGVRIGAGCTIGAGAVVRCDVPDGLTVVGVPAREIERPIEVP